MKEQRLLQISWVCICGTIQLRKPRAYVVHFQWDKCRHVYAAADEHVSVPADFCCEAHQQVNPNNKSLARVNSSRNVAPCLQHKQQANQVQRYTKTSFKLGSQVDTRTYQAAPQQQQAQLLTKLLQLVSPDVCMPSGNSIISGASSTVHASGLHVQGSFHQHGFAGQTAGHACLNWCPAEHANMQSLRSVAQFAKWVTTSGVKCGLLNSAPVLLHAAEPCSVKEPAKSPATHRCLTIRANPVLQSPGLLRHTKIR